MVAMDFFAALNSYDFFNQYCSNLLKNPTVRGLMVMVSSKSIRFSESYALAQLGMPQLSLKNRRGQFTLFVAAAMFLCGRLLNSGRVYVSRHCLLSLIY